MKVPSQLEAMQDETSKRVLQLYAEGKMEAAIAQQLLPRPLSTYDLTTCSPAENPTKKAKMMEPSAADQVHKPHNTWVHIDPH